MNIWLSGDRFLDTPSRYNGGALGNGTASSVVFNDIDALGLGWNERAFEWPAFGGTETALSAGWASSDVDFNLTAHRALALLGWYQIPGVADNGLSIMANAFVMNDGVFVELQPWVGGGDTIAGFGLWGSGTTAEVETSFVANFPGSLDNRDRVCIFPKPGDMPAAIVVWSDNGALQAGVVATELSDVLAGAGASRHLRSVASSAVSLGPMLTYTAASLELAGCYRNGSIVLAWLETDGVHIGRIDAAVDVLELTPIGTITGSYLSVDIELIDDTHAAVIAGAAAGGTVAVLDLSTGVITQTAISGSRAGVRGSAVAGLPVVLSRDGTGWDIWIYTIDLVSFTAFDGGPLASGSTAHPAAILGHPDGRLVVFTRGRIDFGPVQAFFDAEFAGNESYDFASLDLYTYSEGVLTARDQIAEPGSTASDATNSNPARLVPFNDFWFGLVTVGYPQMSGTLNWAGAISWAAIPPNDWFGYVHAISDTRFVKAALTTNYEEWGPVVDVGGDIRFLSSTARFTVFDIDESGAVVAVSDLTQLALQYGSSSNVAAFGDGDTIWIVYDATIPPAGGTNEERISTFTVDEDMTITEVATVTIATGSGHGPLGGTAYLGDGIIVWPDQAGLIAARVGVDGSVTVGPALSYDDLGIEPFGAAFNATGSGAARRVGNGDIVAVVGRHPSDGFTYRQAGVVTVHVDRTTLALTVIDINHKWDLANGTARAEFLGWTQMSATNPMWSFSPDGKTIVFFPSINTTIQPWTGNTPGTQGWYPEAVDEEVVAWVDIDDSGMISVDYQRTAFGWKGVDVGGRPASRLLRRAGTGTGQYYSQQLVIPPSSQTCLVVTALVHADTRGNPDLWVSSFSDTYFLFAFERGAGVTTLRAMTALGVTDGFDQEGVMPALGSAGLFHWSGYPQPFTRCDVGNLEGDAWPMRMQVIGGVGAPRGTTVAGAQNRVVYRTAKNVSPDR